MELTEKQYQIANLATDLFRELLVAHLAESVSDAEDTFQRDENATEPVVKLGISVHFQPLNEKPEVKVKLSWSVKRNDEATGVVDTTQTRLPFAQGGVQ